jgi:hypothetical protein
MPGAKKVATHQDSVEEQLTILPNLMNPSLSFEETHLSASLSCIKTFHFPEIPQKQMEK